MRKTKVGKRVSAALALLAMAACAEEKPAWRNMAEIGPEAYRPLRRELRAFHPGECHDKCRDPQVLDSHANLTFEKADMTPELLAAIFRVFAKGGGNLLQPNCNSVEELLDAQVHPERHLNLMVKVCGFSARFVSLTKRWQDEVIARHRLK